MIEDTLSGTLSASMASLSTDSSLSSGSICRAFWPEFEVDATRVSSLTWRMPMRIGRHHTVSTCDLPVVTMLKQLDARGALEVDSPTAIDVKIQSKPFSAEGAGRRALPCVKCVCPRFKFISEHEHHTIRICAAGLTGAWISTACTATYHLHVPLTLVLHDSG